MKKFILPILYIILAVVITIVTIAVKGEPLPYMFSIFIVLGIFLNSLQNKFGVLSFAAASAVYLFVTFPLALWGEFIINALFVLYFLFTFFFIKEINFKIESCGRKNIIPFFAIMTIIILSYSVVLWFFESQLPLLNAMSTVFAIMQAYFISKRYYEQYFFSVILTATQITLWAAVIARGSGLSNLPILLMNCFFLFIHSYNLFVWRKKYNLEMNK